MSAKPGYHVAIISTSARGGSGPTWGLGVDSQIVEQILRECHSLRHIPIASVDHIDPVSFYGSSRRPTMVDIQIHLEIPCRAAMPWGRVNIVVVNPEWWPSDAWNWAIDEMDYFIFKSNHARSLFPTLDPKKVRMVNWRASSEIQQTMNMLAKVPPKREFLYLVGSSKNKLAAAKVIIACWKITWPQLTIVGSDDVLKQLETRPGVHLLEAFSTNVERITAQSTYAYHVVASVAEGFGYTFAEAACVGALPLWTGIPLYDELWKETLGNVGRISVSVGPATTFRDSTTVQITPEAIELGVQSLLRLSEEDDLRYRGALKHVATTRVKEFRSGWKTLVSTIQARKVEDIPILPPRLPAELPTVAIISLTYNRRHWWANMARNVLKTQYPPDKLCWIIADDSDSAERVDADVIKFQSTHPQIHLKYLSFPKRLAIGDKRNKAILAAPADCSVFVMMDDDDHYPVTSVLARVAWLTGLKTDCVYCSTLPMYDCGKYISAINVPPLDLSPAERISEASLCFTRKFWQDRKFPGPVNVAEGEAFIVGREQQTVEIPPEGIIVSFLHGNNATSRRVPSSTEPNGCHYGFDDEYFSYLCGLAKTLD